MTYREFFEKDRFAAEAGVEIIDMRAGHSKVRMNITPAHLNAVTRIGMRLLDTHDEHPEHEEHAREERWEEPHAKVQEIGCLHKHVEDAHHEDCIHHYRVEQSKTPGNTPDRTRPVLDDLTHNETVGHARNGKGHKEQEYPMSPAQATILGK